MSQANSALQTDISNDEFQRDPIVIIGNGPVGLHAARLLLKGDSGHAVVLYGAEEHKPYNRVKLSSVLAGQIDWSSLYADIDGEDEQRLHKRYGVAIADINPAEKTIIDDKGNVQPYSKLILATGSSPHIPNIEGINVKGRYTFRNIDDVNHLLARQISSRHTVILGGGLLGIEAARAMRRWQTKVTVIEHASHLLSRQLDEEAGEKLAEVISSKGIDLVINDGLRKVNGEKKITSLTLTSGREIACDTLIVATGIVPNKSLAILSGLSVGKGIKVNDRMQTSDEDIYAIGECAEHRGKIYGLVAPGLEQAGVAVHNITGGAEANYAGAIATTRLKVIDHEVLSIGAVGSEARLGFGREHVYQEPEKGVYRKLVVHRNRLVGALSLGQWDEASRIQTHVLQKKLVLPWQIMRFKLTGYLWPEQEMPGVTEWPANATVCQCTGVTRGTISTAIEQGACCAEDVSQQTGASSVCGSCRPLVEELLGHSDAPEKHPQSKTLTITAMLGMAIALLFFLPLQIPYVASVQSPWQWDWLWRDTFAKQVTGFSVLGIFTLGLFVSLRKRVGKLQNLGSFDIWRVVHIMLGILALFGLLLHTGFRLGHGLNQWLMISFAGLIVLGSIYTYLLGQQHRWSPSKSILLKKRMLNWHIYLFWPVPVLLGFHILKGYWF